MPKHRGRHELTWTDKDKTYLSTGDGTHNYTSIEPADRRMARLLHEVERTEVADVRKEVR
jgi:adenine-specific DNA-methyltransferase